MNIQGFVNKRASKILTLPIIILDYRILIPNPYAKDCGLCKIYHYRFYSAIK